MDLDLKASNQLRCYCNSSWVVKCFQIIILSVFLVSLNIEQSYASNGFQEFNLNQSMKESKAALSKRCDAVDFSDTIHTGLNCGRWLGEGIKSISLGYSEGVLGFNKNLIVVFLDFEASDAIEQKILGFLRSAKEINKELTCYNDQRSERCIAVFGGNWRVINDRVYVDKVRFTAPKITVSFHESDNQ